MESTIRVPLLILAASLTLAGCKNNDMHDNTSNVDENLTTENIVSNDVTAIDAVTGDAANMAADVDLNYGNIDENGAAQPSNEPQKKPSTPAPKSPREKTLSAAPEPTTQTATNTQ